MIINAMRQIRQLFEAIAEHKVRSRSFGKALSISVINQVVSSGTNFALGIYLVRALTPTEFGLYGIGFAIALLYSGVGNALLLTQMVVHVPDKANEDKLHYAARVLVLAAVFSLLTALLAGLVLAMVSAWQTLPHEYIGLGSAVTVASIAYLLKDFFVRHAYTARKEKWALAVNMFVALMLATFLFMQRHFFVGIDSASALWIYAASNFAGALVGLALASLPIFDVRARELMNDMQEAWVGGKWALGGVSVTWLQTQAYMYVTALFLGPAGVGYANAARLLITPATFLMPALNQVVMPRFASLRASNPQKLLQVNRLYTTGLIIFSVSYSLILLGLIDVIAPVLLGSHYGQITPLAVAWCLFLIFQFSRGSTSIVLQAIKEFKILTLANIASVVVAIVAAIVLMEIIGVQGAILGTAAGELVLSVLLYRVIKNNRYEYC